MKIRIEVQDREVRAALNRMISLGSDLSPVMRKIAGALESGVEDAFRKEQSPEGVAWDDLSEVTKARREKQRKWPGKKLQVSHDLAGSIHSRHDARSAVAGTNLVYATTHHFGAKKGAFGTGKKGSFPIPWGDIPARPFLGVSAETQGDIVKVLHRHIRLAWQAKSPQ